MRLYLAVAVLMLVLATCTEAQEEVGTIEQRLVKFRDQVVAMSKNAAETAKAMGKKAAETAKVKLEKIKNSEIATNSRNWIQARFDEMSKRLRDMTN